MSRPQQLPNDPNDLVNAKDHLVKTHEHMFVIPVEWQERTVTGDVGEYIYTDHVEKIVTVLRCECGEETNRGQAL